MCILKKKKKKEKVFVTLSDSQNTLLDSWWYDIFHVRASMKRASRWKVEHYWCFFSGKHHLHLFVFSDRACDADTQVSSERNQNHFFCQVVFHNLNLKHNWLVIQVIQAWIDVIKKKKKSYKLGMSRSDHVIGNQGRSRGFRLNWNRTLHPDQWSEIDRYRYR